MSYKYRRVRCPDCGKVVARNWLLRHWRDHCPGLVVKDTPVFDVTLDDGRVARCWQAQSQPYADCVFSAGLVEGLGVDTLYFMVRRDDQDEPYMLFLRPDEMQAVAWVCSGALWSAQMIEEGDDV